MASSLEPASPVADWVGKARIASGIGAFHWRLDSDQIDRDANASLLLGLPAAKPLSHENFLGIVHEEDRPRLETAMRHALEADRGCAFDAEYRIRRADDGTERWIGARFRAAFAEGRACTLAGTIEDITARKQAELTLAASEERYRLLINATADIVWYCDRHGAFVQPQTAWTTYTGQTFEEHRGWGWLAALPEEERATAAAGWLDALGSRRPYRTEIRLWHAASGAYRRVEAQALPIVAAEGEVKEWVGTVRDVEDLRRTESDLKRTEQSLALALEAAELGAWDIDLRTGTGRWSDALFRMMGYEPTPDRIVPRSLWDSTVYPDDVAMVREAARQASLDGGMFRPTHRVLRADTGEIKWVQPAGRLVQDESGEPVRFIGVLADITERKRAEDHLRMLLDELNHRVKNSLATIQSIARQTLRDDMEVSEARRRLEGRIIALANAHELLTRQGWGPADLMEIARTALAPFQPGEIATERLTLAGAAVMLSPKTSLSLTMAFHELATNAAKYGALSKAEGAVAVSWTIEDSRLSITWSESGGPPVRPPARTGFGMRLLERGLARDLSGTVALRFEPHGVQCRITLPLQNSSQ